MSECSFTWVAVDLSPSSLLFTKHPRYEELSPEEKRMYHKNKETYHKSVRHNKDNLLFAKCGDQDQTWVPLFEKAFAKLHGNYRALNYGGNTGEAIESLTGYVIRVTSPRPVLTAAQGA
jgi:hypothetical protein